MTRGTARRHTGKQRGGGFGEHFVGIPRSAYNSPLFIALSPWAVKLLVDLGAQYTGHNNGDLAAAWKLMHPRGWNSETTLNKAKKELLAAGFIVEMRKGRRPNLCSLYALTWRPLNPSPKHDFGPNGFEAYAYQKKLQTTPTITRIVGATATAFAATGPPG
ncbi:hypothetical protein [Ideonella sp. A 288]|uniref:hypothetical protein n=1 Tax=Ideonella sp. A 288 TaxID=1962181 RepID=UPI0013031E52|nr:hypothetical protein [Ideonella sp. A 288]